MTPLTLVVVGLLSGLITGLSPCILPVLPAVFASSSVVVDRMRPVLVVAGLVTSFAVATLLGGAVLSALGLPNDLLLGIGLVAMVVVGLGLIVPPVAHVLERPFARFSRIGALQRGPAFVVGAAFGLVFVPCAGPVLATVTVLAATNQVEWGGVLLTVSFAVGVAIPLLGFALAGQQIVERVSAVRARLPMVRTITGVVLIATAGALFLGVADQVQRAVPGYVAAAQRLVEDNDAARQALGSLTATGTPISFNECEADPSVLANCGPARDFVGIQEWLNTPDGKELTLASLKGQVVLIDFWTYSCINCQRTLPYLTEWDAKYRDAGLTIVGVHAPEFAFEHEVPNVVAAAADLGVRYPIAIDNDFRTWRTYGQRYWPAHYLVDRSGVVRQVHYGEGAYEETERLINELLAQPVT